MLIIWVGLKSSVVVLHIQAAPGAQRAPSLTTGSHCDKRKEPARTTGWSRGRKCGSGTEARKATPSPVIKGGGTFGKKHLEKNRQFRWKKIIVCYKCALKYPFKGLRCEDE